MRANTMRPCAGESCVRRPRRAAPRSATDATDHEAGKDEADGVGPDVRNDVQHVGVRRRRPHAAEQRQLENRRQQHQRLELVADLRAVN